MGFHGKNPQKRNKMSSLLLFEIEESYKNRALFIVGWIKPYPNKLLARARAT
jgi:hypothetical protein